MQMAACLRRVVLYHWSLRQPTPLVTSLHQHKLLSFRTSPNMMLSLDYLGKKRSYSSVRARPSSSPECTTTSPCHYLVKRKSYDWLKTHLMSRLTSAKMNSSHWLELTCE